MIGAVIILLVTVAVGLVLYVYDVKYRRTHPEARPEDSAAREHPGTEREEHNPDLCCGRHLICEKPLSPRPDEPIVYYDDEELDRFAGRDADAYSEEEVEEIRDVMMTLLPQDVPGWARSIQRRGIALPTPLRDELFLLAESN